MVIVQSKHDQAEMELVGDSVTPSGVDVETFGCEQEWHLHPFVNVWPKMTTKISRSRGVVHQPGFCVAARVSRKPEFFIWNSIVVMVSCRHGDESYAFVSFYRSTSTSGVLHFPPPAPIYFSSHTSFLYSL